MSFSDKIIQDNPDKYETILKSRILGKTLQMKLNEYNALQTQYDTLLQSANNNRKRATGGWSRINGGLKQISAAGKDWLWGVNSSDQIYTCKKPCNDSNWIKIPGGLSQLEGGDKEVWGINSLNNIYKMNVDHSDSWRQIPGGLSNISQGGGWVWGINDQNNVYRCKQPCNGEWILDTVPVTYKSKIEDLGSWRDNGSRMINSGPHAYGYTVNACSDACKGYDIFALQNGNGTTGWCVCGNDVAKAKSLGSCNSGPTGGVWCNKVYSTKKVVDTTDKSGPTLVQLSCSDTFVYALDKNKNPWRKRIDGIGNWSNFGTPPTAQFNSINASHPDKVLAIGMKREIYTTNKDGTQAWSRIYTEKPDVATLSGDPENANYYMTNTGDAIYRHEPLQQGGYWTDLQNENYQTGMVTSPTEGTNDWKFLGKSDTLDECKLKAVEDNDVAFSSVVYYPEDVGTDWKKSCFGGVKGKNINSNYQSNTITSLAPNGTTRLGGEEGAKILKEMKKVQDEIKKLTKKSKDDGVGLEKTNNMFGGEMNAKNDELDKLLGKLKTDRIEIDRLMSEPDQTAGEEDSNIRQISSYTNYGWWLLLVIISIYVAYHIYSREIYEISILAYLFIGIWILIIGKQYYTQSKEYGRSTLNYISAVIPDPV